MLRETAVFVFRSVTHSTSVPYTRAYAERLCSGTVVYTYTHTYLRSRCLASRSGILLRRKKKKKMNKINTRKNRYVVISKSNRLKIPCNMKCAQTKNKRFTIIIYFIYLLRAYGKVNFRRLRIRLFII